MPTNNRLGEWKDELRLLPADYLMRNQPSEPERVEKIKAQAEDRRKQRNLKRLNSKGFLNVEI